MELPCDSAMKPGPKENNNPKNNPMKIPTSSSNFESCPEYTGKAVCVDVTPLRKWQSQYGEQDVFKIVFEVDLERDDGSRFCVWSRQFTLSLGDKANLRKFLRGWNGRDMTKEELANFDTDYLIGKGAQVVVVHEHKDDQVYANIVACTPDKSGAPLKPCGKYVRVQDRPLKDGRAQAAGGGSATSGGYRRAEQPNDPDEDLGATKIHVGRCKGLEVRDLAPEQVQALIDNWLPGAKASAKPLADDRRLMIALDWWAAKNAESKPDPNDDVPY